MAENDDASLIGYDPLAWLQHAEAARPAASWPLPGTEAEASSQDANQEWVEQTDTSEQADDDGWVNDDATAHAWAADDPAPAPTSQQSLSISLATVQNMQAVAQLYQRLLSALNETDHIDIDASAVNQIDTSTLQLLLVFKRTAIKQNKRVSIDFPSERFIEAASLLGLSQLLAVDHAAAGFF
ncbi:MAG: STAS domain-containing protein [Methylomonas sp.]|nr:STAS domain-containing protein [Methylomonas sp.]PPD20963.1 MAG: hypothetical protein CTY23_07035 [Methylomonas sp.]PPD27208.1 MAG: hypothetical protein CTY22_02605 [Methylomonas sp.]PPD39158.1 MAG: hypothetical protein CTY21_02600 [Methylomonas sp.]PPD41317.1 MAG: hypothetical protein CTY17_04165 [Methylomonas sp.]